MLGRLIGLFLFDKLINSHSKDKEYFQSLKKLGMILDASNLRHGSRVLSIRLQGLRRLRRDGKEVRKGIEQSLEIF